MPRRKAERVYVPKENEISRKALKNNEYTYWGPEPIWTADYDNITRREWDALEKSERISKFPRSVELAHLEWFQMKAPERQAIVDYAIEIEVGNAFNWYNAMVDDGIQKEYLINYADKYFPDKVAALKEVDEREFHTYGALARCQMRGAKIPKKWEDKLKERIGKLAQQQGNKTEGVAVLVSKPVVRVERDPQISNFIGIVMGQLDDYGIYSKKAFPEESMADCLLKAGATNGQRKKVYEYFSKQILEYFQAISGVEDIAEYYEGIPKKQLKKAYNWLTEKPSEELVQSARKSRKPRKKKEKTPKQILKRFSCKDSDEDLGIQSIDSEDILGAQQLWIFNTKTRRLGVYHATDDSGLGVSRKSITNYDEGKSISKKIRKPEEVVPGVKTAGKVALRHLLENIRAVETPLRSRINGDTLLLRVVK